MAQTGSFAPQALPAARSGSFDDNNRQTQADGQTLSYDANGNLVSEGVRTYVWNARDQLVEIKQGTASIASFGYDPLGRRVSKTEGGQTISYLYDGLDAVQETQGGTVNPIPDRAWHRRALCAERSQRTCVFPERYPGQHPCTDQCQRFLDPALRLHALRTD
ncbi:MAG: hypothetical protein ABW002_14380 [Xanthomonas sp.]